MPKRRSVVPGYSKRLQRMMRRFNVPKSVVAVDKGKPGGDHTAEATCQQDPDGTIVVEKVETHPVELDTECFTGGQHDDPK